jgi:hypothetical protein
VLAALLAGCTAEDPTLAPPPSAAASPSLAGPAADVALPDGALRDRVPAPADVPLGLVPLLQGSGPRTAEEVAAFSADPQAAAADLRARGFQDAYAAQYAAPGTAQALTVVVVRFADEAGAAADLAADAATATGEPVPARVGDASDVRRLGLDDPPGTELVTVRTRRGPLTWLVAWRSTAPADAEVPLQVARALTR